MKTITWFWEEMDGNPKAYLNVLVWEFDETEGWWDIIDHDCGESNEDGDIDPREVVGRAMLEHRVNRLEEFGVVEPPQSLGEVA